MHLDFPFEFPRDDALRKWVPLESWSVDVETPTDGRYLNRNSRLDYIFVFLYFSRLDCVALSYSIEKEIDAWFPYNMEKEATEVQNNMKCMEEQIPYFFFFSLFLPSAPLILVVGGGGSNGGAESPHRDKPSQQRQTTPMFCSAQRETKRENH